MPSKNKSDSLKKLRKKAEKNLQYEKITLHDLKKNDLLKTLHELHVHQVELEIRNDELRQIREDLELSRSKYADLFEFAPVGYFVTDKKGNIEQVNLTGSSMLGRPRNTLSQKPFTIYVAREDRDIFYLSHEKVLKTAEHVHCDLRMLRKGKDDFFANLLIEPVKDAQNNVIQTRIALIDITEKKLAEQEIKQSEAKYRSLFESIDEGFCIIEVIFDEREKPVDYRFLEINPAFEQQTGLTNARGMRMRELAPAHEEYWFETYGRIARTGEPVRFQNQAAQLDRWYDVYAWRHGPPQNRQVAILFNDITRHKQVEEALRQSEQDLVRAQIVGNIGSWRMDTRKNELTWSDQNHRIFGVPRGKQMTYETFLATVHPDDRQYVDDKWQAALKGEPYDIEHRIIVDGKTKWVREKAFLEFDEKGGLTGGYGITQDITDKKKILEELKKSRDNLESRVRERTAQLRQANIDLMRQAELLDLAHDTIIVHDLDGKIIFWNKGAERTYGFAKKDVLGKITHQILKTRFSEPLLKIVTAVSTKGAWEGELVQTAKNADKLIVESRWALQKDENGKPSAILEIDRDITDRKAAQKQTEEARIYAESIIETIEEAILVLDSGLKIISANKAFYKTFSMKPKNIIGKFVYEIADGHWKLPEFRKLLEDILPKKTVINDYEIDYPGKKGTIHLLLNAKEIFENKDDKRRILLAFYDITIHRLQEKALKELTEQLLFSEERQRQQIATALHDSVGQILTFSKWELDKLLKDSNLRTDNRIKQLQNQINESIKQSRKLTVDLSSPTLHEFGLEAGLEELADQFSAENGVKCRLKTTKTQKPLEKRIELLLYRSVKELLHNINKHAKAENVTINVGTTKNFLEIKVADDGRGFNISRLNSGNNKKKSFGLFSIEQRLTNVGGSFDIRSEKKKGTTVTLLAPLKIKENKKEQ